VVSSARGCGPPDLSIRLAELPKNGRVISSEEYESSKMFYFELLLSGGPKCDGGVDFADEGNKYERVSICQIEATRK
jgi:hypothetical protein